MNLKKAMSVSLVAAVFAGCCLGKCGSKCCAKKGPVGSWGLYLPYDSMNAGHMIISEVAPGQYKALTLLRWASPEKCEKVEVCGDRFKVIHPWGFVIKGISGDKEAMCTIAKIGKDGKTDKPLAFKAVRNPPVCPKASTKDAQFGTPVDLLKDGLGGFKGMGTSGEFGWTFKDGVLSNRVRKDANGKWVGHGINLMTKREDFFDFNLEYDVRVPKGANSGVYLRGRYEIQTIDSYGQKPDCHNMAAFYGRITPSCSAEKPAGEWQHVSVTLYKRHVTVVLNGVTIIDDKPVEGVTGGAIDCNEFVPGPLYIQGDHSDADYRNMILRPAL